MVCTRSVACAFVVRASRQFYMDRGLPSQGCDALSSNMMPGCAPGFAMKRAQGLETAGACGRPLQAGAFSRHSRRAAANRLLRGARGELHGRRRAAACAACRVAPTLYLVAPRRGLVDRLDAAARP